jgi:hypothetical protein
MGRSWLPIRRMPLFCISYSEPGFRDTARISSAALTHSGHHDINAIAFSLTDPRVMYLGLEVEGGVR